MLRTLELERSIACASMWPASLSPWPWTKSMPIARPVRHCHPERHIVECPLSEFVFLDWSTPLAGVCVQWSVYSTTATDFPEATKALASELGAAANAGPTSTGSAASSGSTAGAVSTSSSKGAAAAATPVMGLLGAAALAGILV